MSFVRFAYLIGDCNYNYLFYLIIIGNYCVDNRKVEGVCSYHQSRNRGRADEFLYKNSPKRKLTERKALNEVDSIATGDLQIFFKGDPIQVKARLYSQDFPASAQPFNHSCWFFKWLVIVLGTCSKKVVERWPKCTISGMSLEETKIFRLFCVHRVCNVDRGSTLLVASDLDNEVGREVFMVLITSSSTCIESLLSDWIMISLLISIYGKLLDCVGQARQLD
ncbi:hypothetical protein BY458DRAFT_494797 [Sporodiniella umbellata]|nr:hypothetical protein BY458DRAFT_494797 [Sporodiniella umbellata]